MVDNKVPLRYNINIAKRKIRGAVMESKAEKKPLRHIKTLNVVYIGIFAAVIAVCSWIQIPLVVPITLQTLGICVAAGLLGFKKGVITVVVYELIGFIGVPVFSNFGAGPGVLLGVTGGYIVGFIFTAAIVGGAVSRLGKKLPVYILSMILGVAVCYVFGTAWFMVWSSNNGSAATLGGALMSCVVPFIIPDLVKIAVASFLCTKLSKFIRA